jgi:hypothetical protein
VNRPTITSVDDHWLSAALIELILYHFMWEADYEKPMRT